MQLHLILSPDQERRALITTAGIVLSYNWMFLLPIIEQVFKVRFPSIQISPYVPLGFGIILVTNFLEILCWSRSAKTMWVIIPVRAFEVLACVWVVLLLLVNHPAVDFFSPRSHWMLYFFLMTTAALYIVSQDVPWIWRRLFKSTSSHAPAAVSFLRKD